jgi:hypothetical protein
MRPLSRLGAANLALISVYFAPMWGRDAVRALMSPYNGLEDKVHSAAAIYFRQLFDLGLDGLMRTSNVLAGVKLVIAAGFVAYAIEYARSLFSGRDVDRGTVDVVLALAFAGIAVWALPALALDDAALVRTYATQLLLVAGAVIVILVERHVEQPQQQPSIAATAERERLATTRLAQTGATRQAMVFAARATERR